MYFTFKEQVYMPCSLVIQIERKKVELLHIANKHGLSSNQTIKCSQDLDKLLNKYQRTIEHISRNKS